MTIYTVVYGGERLDVIARKIFQTERQGTVEALLSGNPGLALKAENGIVPGGEQILVPDFQPASKSSSLVLAWE